VRLYNTELRTYPGVLWAKILYATSKPMADFSVADDVKRNPQVKF
jgi:LemA protein